MPQVNYAEDIVPLSSFRADVTRLMSQTRKTHRPIVITQNGRAANVFLDVSDYQQLVDKLDLMMDIYKGERDIAAGCVHSTDDVCYIVTVRRCSMLFDEKTLTELDSVE